jgi:hypothetical protein
MQGQLLVVPASSLDSDLPLKPNARIFVASRARWDDALDKIPMMEGVPS